MGAGGAKRTLQWGSRFGFLMAAIGSAVGLGNLWRFPFQAGQHGGGAFVIVYIGCVALIAYPVLMAELAIGRHQGLSAVGSTRNLAVDAGASPRWQIVGWFGCAATLVVLPGYSMIAGQIMAYSFIGFTSGVSADAAPALYDGPLDSLFWLTLSLGATVGIVLRGLNKGVETASMILMPAFFAILAALAIYALLGGAAEEAVNYLFNPRFDEITPEVVLAALGQALFSLGVGGAIMVTYGSFLSKEENIGVNSGIIAGADTLVAIVAGLMIFPIVFAHGMDPAAGMGLIFGALPAFFANMPFGHLISGAFFFLAFIAALTSTISMLMILRVVGIEQFGMSERGATLVFGAFVWLCGVAIIAFDGLGERMDWAVGSVLLPLGALGVALLAGWAVPRNIMRGELARTHLGIFAFWRVMIRYAVPIAVGAIFVMGLTA